MKIALFLNKDIHANIAYNLLKPELLKHDVRIYYTDQVGKASGKPEALQNLEYQEKERFFEEVAQTYASHEFEFLNEKFKSFPLQKAPKVNDSTFIALMKDFGPDLFISIRFGKIFKDEIISVPKHGLLNLHSGILPDYRGIMATLHALIDQKNEIGCTLHSISDAGIDTGEIINKSSLKTKTDKSLLWHICHVYPAGILQMIEAIQQLEHQVIVQKKTQNLTEGRYFSTPTTQDFLNLKESGFEVFTEADYQAILKAFIAD
ncbi:MAG: formyl transferase [Psychroflexus sp.]|nr:formyl transferase [Psychroflexus sp.]MDN6310930.1 formyl transferase [Psychroflexus sp.]